jgi:regulatory protein
MSQGPRRTPAERRLERAGVEDLAIVLAAAARFLEARHRSVDEVRRRLLGAGYRSSLVDAAIVRLSQLGYLDDAAFARGWVESRDRARPSGGRALRVELRRKGVAPDVIDEVLRERDGETTGGRSDADGSAEDPDEPRQPADMVAARRLLDRRGAVLRRVTDPRRRRQRAYALLARHGFDAETIRTALDQAEPGGEIGPDDEIPAGPEQRDGRPEPLV